MLGGGPSFLRPQSSGVSVGRSVARDTTIADPDRPRAQCFEKSPVVTHHDAHAVKASKGVDEQRVGRGIDMVRGLVQEEEVRLGHERTRHLPSLLPPWRERGPSGLVDILEPEPASGLAGRLAPILREVRHRGAPRFDPLGNESPSERLGGAFDAAAGGMEITTQ